MIRARIIIHLVWVFTMLIGAECAWADPVTLVWQRNTEIDMDHYEVYWCTTSDVCVPDPSDNNQKMWVAVVPQPPIGSVPSVQVVAGSQGNVGVIAVNATGGRSPLSNVVAFKDGRRLSHPGMFSIQR